MLSIPWDLLTQLTPSALVSLFVLLIMLGRLVPLRTVLRTVRQLETERDQWREVALRTMAHTDQLMPVAQITTDMLRPLRSVAEREDEEP